MDVDTFSAIRLGKAIADCAYDLAPNAEQHLRSRLRLGNIYPESEIQETLRIASLCNFALSELRYEYRDELVLQGKTPASFLRQEVYTGAQQRYPHGISAETKNKIEYPPCFYMHYSILN